MINDGCRWFLMINDDSWWFLMIYDDQWWLIMINDDEWWWMMVSDDLWCAPFGNQAWLGSIPITHWGFICLTYICTGKGRLNYMNGEFAITACLITRGYFHHHESPVTNSIKQLNASINASIIIIVMPPPK